MAAFFRQISLFDPVEEVQSFGHDSFEALCQGSYSHIEVSIRPRLWESWRARWSKRDAKIKIEIPSLLAEAPEQVKLALLQWAILVSQKRKIRDLSLIRDQRIERKRLETLIRQFLHASAKIPSTPAHLKLAARNKRKFESLAPIGQNHNLLDSFRRVNIQYFHNQLSACVTWSARLGGLSTHSLAQNEMGENYHLISISRGYDSPDVTPEILDGVMYHECLHAAIPPEIQQGRRIVHGPEFRRREKAYAHFKIWRDWHRHGLPKSLRRLKKSGIEAAKKIST